MNAHELAEGDDMEVGDLMDALNWPSREMLIDKATEALCDMAGIEATEGEDFDIWRENAEVVIDALIEAVLIFPSERFDEECHVCERDIRDHFVDGRHPYDHTLKAVRDGE